MLKAVIFDMDGVLTDTVTFGREIRGKILAEHYGVNLDEIPDPQGQNHRVASMKTLLASIENYSGKRIDIEKFAELQAQCMREELPKLVSLDPALLHFLDELRQHNITCAVVTTAQRSGTDIKLDLLGIRSYFSAIVTGNDIENHKPHPEAYLYAIEKLGVPPKDCIIFEDSLPGIQAGLAAGCRVIGFTQYNPPCSRYLVLSLHLRIGAISTTTNSFLLRKQALTCKITWKFAVPPSFSNQLA